MGRLVRDPEVRYTQNNKMVVNFTLAVHRRMKEETDFFNIIAWNKTGEFVSKYFKKGVQVSVTILLFPSFPSYCLFCNLPITDT